MGAESIRWIRNWMIAHTQEHETSVPSKCSTNNLLAPGQIPQGVLQTIKYEVFNASFILKWFDSSLLWFYILFNILINPVPNPKTGTATFPNVRKPLSLLESKTASISRGSYSKTATKTALNPLDHYVEFLHIGFPLRNFWTTYTIFSCLNFLITNKAQKSLWKHASHNLPALQEVAKTQIYKSFYLFQKGKRKLKHFKCHNNFLNW